MAVSGSGGSTGTSSGGGSGGSQAPGGIAGSGVAGSGIAGSGVAGSGVAGSGVAGSGTAGGPSGQTATLSAVAAILKESCGALSCHGGGPEGRDVVFTDPATLYQTLTTTVVAPCNNKPLVTPGQSANSALLMLPTWQCDDFVMPQGCFDDPCLPTADLATISAWIDAGAPNP